MKTRAADTGRGRAAGATAITVGVMVLILVLGRLSFDATALPDPPRPVVEVLVPEEEYVETFTPAPSDESPAPAAIPEPARRESRASAPSSEPASKAQGPTGPTREELEQQRIAREVGRGVADAFAPSAQDNTDSRGPERGDSGRQGDSTGAIRGNGTGNVTGGWIMPSYARVPATTTGRIELRARIDSQGHVISCEMTGGKAPAASDNALVAACIAEVRRHTFRRNDDDAPPQATATIIYNFH